MSTALYIVASPLQMLYALEARYKYKSSKHIICILRTGFSYDRKQIDDLLNQYQWDDVYQVNWHGSSNYLRTLYQVFLAQFLRVKFGVFDRIFLGDFAFALCTFLKYREIFLISDGNKIIWQVKNYENSRKIEFTRHKAINRFLDVLLGRVIKLKLDFKYFTPFVLESKDTETHSFEWLKQTISNEVKDNDEVRGVVYFLGAYMSEGIWTKYTTEEYFFWCMERIFDYYQCKGYKLIYIPHRHESSEKLERLKKNIPTLEFEYFDRGVELEFYCRGVKPEAIASFSSTALYTLKRIYPQCRSEAFLLDKNNFLPKKFWWHFEKIYEYYSKYILVNDELLIRDD